LKNVSFQPLYLHVKVDDALLMNELDALANLAHENGAGPFRQDEIVVDDPLEQLAAFDPVSNCQDVRDLSVIPGGQEVV
jgi:hypothetical protein